MYKNSTKNLGLPQYDVQDYFQPITDLNPAFEKLDGAITENKENYEQFSAEMERRVGETEKDIVNLTGRVNALRAEHDADHAVLNGLKDWEEEAKGQLEQLRADVDNNTSNIETLTQELNDEIQRAKNAEGDLGVRISAANVAAAEAQVAAGRAEKAAGDASEAAVQAGEQASNANERANEAANSAADAAQKSNEAVEKANSAEQSVSELTTNFGELQDNLKNKPNYNGYVNPDTAGTYDAPVTTPLKVMSDKDEMEAVDEKHVYDTGYINELENTNSAAIQNLTTQQSQLETRLSNFDTELDSLGQRVEVNEDGLTSHDARIQLVESNITTVNQNIAELQETQLKIASTENLHDTVNNSISVLKISGGLTAGIAVKADDGTEGIIEISKTRDNSNNENTRLIYNTDYINKLEASLKNNISDTDKKAEAGQVQSSSALSQVNVVQTQLGETQQQVNNISKKAPFLFVTDVEEAHLPENKTLTVTLPYRKNGKDLSFAAMYLVKSTGGRKETSFLTMFTYRSLLIGSAGLQLGIAGLTPVAGGIMIKTQPSKELDSEDINFTINVILGFITDGGSYGVRIHGYYGIEDISGD